MKLDLLALFADICCWQSVVDFAIALGIAAMSVVAKATFFVAILCESRSDSSWLLIVLLFSYA